MWIFYIIISQLWSFAHLLILLKTKATECSWSISHRTFEIRTNRTLYLFTLQMIIHSLILYFFLFEFRKFRITKKIQSFKLSKLEIVFEEFWSFDISSNQFRNEKLNIVNHLKINIQSRTLSLNVDYIILKIIFINGIEI